MRRIDPDAEAARLAEERKRATEAAAAQSGAAAKLAALRAAVQAVLDDEESRPGGWGPDITMVGVLREAMEATGP